MRVCMARECETQAISEENKRKEPCFFFLGADKQKTIEKGVVISN